MEIIRCDEMLISGSLQFYLSNCTETWGCYASSNLHSYLGNSAKSDHLTSF